MNAIEEIKIDQMELHLLRHFKKNPTDLQALLSTGSEIIIMFNQEHDNFWGHCTCEECKDKEHHNHRGFLLMKIRLNTMIKEELCAD